MSVNLCFSGNFVVVQERLSANKYFRSRIACQRMNNHFLQTEIGTFNNVHTIFLQDEQSFLKGSQIKTSITRQQIVDTNRTNVAPLCWPETKSILLPIILQQSRAYGADPYPAFIIFLYTFAIAALGRKMQKCIGIGTELNVEDAVKSRGNPQISHAVNKHIVDSTTDESTITGFQGEFPEIVKAGIITEQALVRTHP